MHKLSFEKQKKAIAIVFFVTTFLLVITVKPTIVYNLDGSLKQFGLGYKNKTVIPMWLICIILAIFSYLAVSLLANIKI